MELPWLEASSVQPDNWSRIPADDYDWSSYRRPDVDEKNLELPVKFMHVETHKGNNDWKLGNRDYAINFYGVTDNGQSICIIIRGLVLHIAFKLPTHPENERSFFEMFKTKLIDTVNDIPDCWLKDEDIELELKRGQSIYNYTADDSTFVIVYSHRYYALKKLSDYFTTKPVSMDMWNGTTISMWPYDICIEPETQLNMLLNCRSCSWFELLQGKKIENEKSSYCQLEYEAHWEDIQTFDLDSIAPLRLLSIDLEAIFDGDPFTDAIIAIGLLTSDVNDMMQGGDEDRGIALSLGPCEKNEDSTYDTYEFSTEKAMLEALFNFIIIYDPDILTGYNIRGYDFPKLVQRAKLLGIPHFEYLGRSTMNKCFHSNPGSFNCGFHVPGRAFVDMLAFSLQTYKLRSNTLNAVSSKFLEETKDDMRYDHIKRFWLQSDEGRTKINKYCVKDAILPVRLIKKLDVFTRLLLLARLTGVTITKLLTRGQVIKVLNCLLFYNHEHLEGKYFFPARDPNYVVPPYPGGYVFEPKAGYYLDPIVMLDFQSLYPSIIIAYNISYDTMIILPTGQKPSVPAWEGPWKNREYSHKTIWFVKKEVKVGIVPSILEFLLKERRAAKKDMFTTIDPFIKAIKDSLQLGLKVICNSVYGFTVAPNSPVPEINLAGNVTREGQRSIQKVARLAEEGMAPYFQSARLIGGDSVSGSTPITLRKYKSIIYAEEIEKLATCWNFQPSGKQEARLLSNIEVWTSKGWANIIRVIRHKTNKEIYRVYTQHGTVEVTKDHSLLNHDGEILKPEDIIMGKTQLLHKVPKFVKPQKYDCDDNSDVCIQNQVLSEYSKGHSVYFTLDELMLPNETESNRVMGMECLGKCGGYVYDIETSTGDFQAGVGSIIVKNTDSVFVMVDYDDEEDLRRKGFVMAETMSKEFPPPMKLEFESIFWKSIFHTKKKRYAMLLEETDDKNKKKTIKSKGFETVRRDNCPLVGKLMMRCMHALLKESIPIGELKMELMNEIMNVRSGDFSLYSLIVSQSVSRPIHKYKAKLPHVELLKRLHKLNSKRWPLSEGIRVPYIVCQGSKNDRKFERVQHPLHVVEYKYMIDVEYYVNKQLKNPLTSLLSSVMTKNDLNQIFTARPKKLYTGQRKEKIPDNCPFAGWLTLQFTCMAPHCRTVSEKRVCVKCRKNTKMMAKLLKKHGHRLKQRERMQEEDMDICRDCAGDIAEQCEAYDCEHLYERMTSKQLVDDQRIRYEALIDLSST